MAAVVDLPFSLPSASSGHKAAGPSSLSKPTADTTLLPVGPSYIAHTRRQLRQLSFEDDDQAEKERLDALKAANSTGEEDVDIPDEEETQDLLDRDPKEWKVSTHTTGARSLRRDTDICSSEPRPLRRARSVLAPI